MHANLATTARRIVVLVVATCVLAVPAAANAAGPGLDMPIANTPGTGPEPHPSPTPQGPDDITSAPSDPDPCPDGPCNVSDAPHAPSDGGVGGGGGEGGGDGGPSAGAGDQPQQAEAGATTLAVSPADAGDPLGLDTDATTVVPTASNRPTGELPYTGAETWVVAILGATLIGAGVGCMALGRASRRGA